MEYTFYGTIYKDKRMKTLHTDFPVYTHTGIELVPAGTKITKKLITTVLNLKANRTLFSIGELYGKDIAQIIEKDVYQVIFKEKESRENVFTILNQISLPACEIEAIEYIKEHDYYVYEHLLTVFSLSIHFSSILRNKSSSMGCFKGSLSHDIGKICIPINILHKNIPLTAEEHEHIKHHTVAGTLLLNYYTGMYNCTSSIIARDHHENRKGTGYPCGRKRLDLYTEIVIVCDIYDALLSPRSYRKEAFNNRSAIEELTKKALAGTISKKIVKVLIAENRRVKTTWQECAISNDFRGIYPKMNNYGKTKNVIGPDPGPRSTL